LGDTRTSLATDLMINGDYQRAKSLSKYFSRLIVYEQKFPVNISLIADLANMTTYNI
jgi:hypothetical protein